MYANFHFLSPVGLRMGRATRGLGEAARDVLDRAGVRLGKTYRRPIVDHAEAGDRALAAYNKIR